MELWALCLKKLKLIAFSSASRFSFSFPAFESPQVVRLSVTMHPAATRLTAGGEKLRKPWNFDSPRRFLQQRRDKRINDEVRAASAVTIGSPLRFSHQFFKGGVEIVSLAPAWVSNCKLCYYFLLSTLANVRVKWEFAAWLSELRFRFVE